MTSSMSRPLAARRLSYRKPFSQALRSPDLSGAVGGITALETAPRIGRPTNLATPHPAWVDPGAGGRSLESFPKCAAYSAPATGSGGSIDARYATMSVMSSTVRFSMTGNIRATCGPFRVPIFISQS
jgi:hypothetical protein